jgi:hypothetical protein
MTRLAVFLSVGIVFLALFIPYIVWVKAETTLKRSQMTEDELTARLYTMFGWDRL